MIRRINRLFRKANGKYNYTACSNTSFPRKVNAGFLADFEIFAFKFSPPYLTFFNSNLVKTQMYFHNEVVLRQNMQP